MTLLELKEEVINLREELKNTISKGEAECRELNEEETSHIAELRTKIDDCEKQISDLEKENRNIEKNNKNQNKTENMEIRLLDLINEVVSGNVKDEHRSFISGNKIDLRTVNVSTATEGQENVAEIKKPLEAAIRNASVLDKIGASFYTGLKGDVSIPRVSAQTCGWASEVAEAANGEGTFGETNLKPLRLTTFIDISKTFLAQDANGAEAVLIGDLAKAIAEKLDMTVFGADAAEEGVKPAGLFNGKDTIAVGDIDYNTVLDLELGVEKKNGINYIFVANPDVKMQLKGTQLAHGLGFVYQGGEIDGLKTVVSNSVKGIMCLCPEDLAVGQWGGMDITIDTVSQAIYNKVRVVINAYYDAKMKGDRIAALGVNA